MSTNDDPRKSEREEVDATDYSDVELTVEPLCAAPRPCNTCPYARSTPRGIWAASEYEKLLDYDDDPEPHRVFHCHQETATGVATVCRGWLSVHPDGLAVRLAVAQGRLTPAQRDAEPLVDLYRSGLEAALAGLADVDAMSDAALLAAERLIERGVGEWDPT